MSPSHIAQKNTITWSTRSGDLQINFNPSDITWTGTASEWQTELRDESSSVATMFRNVAIASNRAGQEVRLAVPSMQHTLTLAELQDELTELHRDLRSAIGLFSVESALEVGKLNFQKKKLDWRDEKHRQKLVDAYVNDGRFLSELKSAMKSVQHDPWHIADSANTTIWQIESWGSPVLVPVQEESDVRDSRSRLAELQRMSIVHALLEDSKIFHVDHPSFVHDGQSSSTLIEWVNTIESDPEDTRGPFERGFDVESSPEMTRSMLAGHKQGTSSLLELGDSLLLGLDGELITLPVEQESAAEKAKCEDGDGDENDHQDVVAIDGEGEGVEEASEDADTDTKESQSSRRTEEHRGRRRRSGHDYHVDYTKTDRRKPDNLDGPEGDGEGDGEDEDEEEDECVFEPHILAQLENIKLELSPERQRRRARR